MKKNSDTNNRPKGRRGTDKSGQAADQAIKADVASGVSEERNPVVWEDGKCSWRDEANDETIDVNELLQDFVCEDKFKAMQRRAGEIGAALAATVYLAGRQTELMSLLTALVHVSPTKIVLPGGRRLRYGPLQGLIVGESGSFKTTATSDLSEQLGLAELATSDTTTRAGLLYRVRGKDVVPGLLPRNDNRMVVVDEFHKTRPQEIRAATCARSRGVLRVDSCNSATFDMQTRLLCIGNLRHRGSRGLNGSESISLADLDAGILGTGFLEPEDIRRFDFAAVVGRVGAEAIQPTVEPMDMGRFSRLVRLYWRIGAQGDDECIWSPAACNAARDVAAALNERFETPMLPLLGPDSQDKVFRLAAAVARLMPTEPDGRIHITESHVRWAGFVLFLIYELPNNGLADIAGRDRRRQDDLGHDEMESLLYDLLGDVPEIPTILNVLACRNSITTGELAIKADVAIRTMGSRVSFLKRVGLLTSHGRAGLKPTQLMRRLVRWEMKQFGKDSEGRQEEAVA
jgi:hypothetical protein